MRESSKRIVEERMKMKMMKEEEVKEIPIIREFQSFASKRKSKKKNKASVDDRFEVEQFVSDGEKERSSWSLNEEFSFPRLMTRRGM